MVRTAGNCVAGADCPADDREIVARQLGRRSLQPFHVVRRCPAGFPMVIQTDPVSGDRVFTTLYWLTCPKVSRQIGRWESEGWIGRIESEVAGNPAARDSMASLHAQYTAARQEAIGADRMAELRSDQPRVAAFLDRTGIAGVSDFTHIKCLHAHAAFHLAHGDHPVFNAHPEFLPDISDCRECAGQGRPSAEFATDGASANSAEA